MVDPPPWPDRPPEAQDFDLFWLVRKLPPEPFPVEDYDYGSDPRFGPPGTRWVFSLESLYNRQTLPGTSTAVKAAIERLFKKLAVRLPPLGSTSWVQDYPLAPPATPVREPMRYARVAIVGKLGTTEQIVHTLNLRTAPNPDVDQDVAGVQILANQVRDIWAAWWASVLPGGNALSNLFSPDLHYTEVRAAYVSLPGTGERETFPAPQPRAGIKKMRDKIVYNYPPAEYLVRTQYANFTNDPHGTSSGFGLPYETACCLTLDSGRRGAANRGRLYLGGLATSWMTAGGEFDSATVQRVASSFATGVVKAINVGTGYDVHVVSRYWNDSIPVSSVRAGVVPDSQRRRRRSQQEKFGAPIATPLVGP